LQENITVDLNLIFKNKNSANFSLIEIGTSFIRYRYRAAFGGWHTSHLRWLLFLNFVNVFSKLLPHAHLNSNF
jgi:hypothetical protein